MPENCSTSSTTIPTSSPASTSSRCPALPLLPWHGLWSSVSPKNGSEVTVLITLTTQTRPTGRSELAADMFQGVFRHPRHRVHLQRRHQG